MLVASFSGTNREFREWLAAGMPANVVSLAEYRRKRKNRSRRRAARAKPVKPIIAWQCVTFNKEEGNHETYLLET